MGNLNRCSAWHRRGIGSSCFFLLVFWSAIGSAPPAAAQGWSAEVFAGTAWNLPLPLHFSQPGEQPLRFRARYRTRPWTGAPYYALRLGYAKWQAELIHHKLYLQNPPPEVEHFEVSHGYNLALLNRTFPASSYAFRVGIGLVIGHPEGSVRGKEVGPLKSLLGGGYQLGGVCLQLAVAREVFFSHHLFLTPEAKLTTAWARFPLAGGGHATVPNIAFHTLLGLGYRTGGR